jgi:hypothetical protein
MKIAEALLLRKQLEGKVAQLTPIKQVGDAGLFEIKIERKQVNDNVDEVKFQVPKVTMAEVTREYDHYAAELRKIDTAIQKANWQFDVDYSEKQRPNEQVKTA